MQNYADVGVTYYDLQPEYTVTNTIPRGVSLGQWGVCATTGEPFWMPEIGLALAEVRERRWVRKSTNGNGEQFHQSGRH